MQSYDGKKRLFLALWPDDSIRQQLVPLIPASTGNGIKPQNLHITLVFLGDVAPSIAEQLIQRIDRLHPNTFSLTLDTTGYWSVPAIFWAGMQQVPDELLSLVKSLRKCARKQKLKVETRSYKPHVSLARKVKQRIQSDRPVNIEWQVDRFVLVESCQIEGGVEYRVIHEWLLQASESA